MRPIAVAISALTLSACGSAVEEISIDPITPIVIQDPIQQDINELDALMGIASPTGNIDSLILPDSDDLDNIPQDVMNPLTVSKVRLGKMLYHETGMTAGNEEIHKDTFSCASCHNGESGFKSGIIQGVGEGGMGHADQRVNVMGEGSDVQPVSSPTTLNIAYQEAMLWNGQFGNSINGIVNATIDESILSTEGTPKVNNARQWSGIEVQAVAGLGVHRLNVSEDSPINTYPEYKELVAEIGEDDLLVAASLAIAAYERTLLANQSPFQKYLRGEKSAMTHNQIKGAKLFFGKASCSSCHNGAALSSPLDANEADMFMAIGFGDLDSNDDIVGEVTDAVRKGRGGFTGNEYDNYKFKIPPLYNLKDTNVFGHGSTFASVREVVEYKNVAVPQKDVDNLDYRFEPLELTNEEVDLLVEFLEDGLYDDNLMRYVPTSLPSGNCVTNNDIISKGQLGC